MNKRVLLFSLLVFGILLLQIYSLSLVSAAEGDTFTQSIVNFVTGTIDVFTQTGEPLFKVLLGDVTGGSNLFVKVLMLLLVLLVVAAVLEQVPFFAGRYWMQFFAAFLVSVIGMRFIPNDMINAMALPSSVLVATLVIGIPFLLFGILLHQSVKNSYIRRAGWVLFIAVLIVLWAYNYKVNKGAVEGFYWIYPLFIVLCSILFWLDGTMQHFWNKSKAQSIIEGTTSVQINRIEAEIRDLQGTLAAAKTAEKRREVHKQINEKKAAMRELINSGT